MKFQIRWSNGDTGFATPGIEKGVPIVTLGKNDPSSAPLEFVAFGIQFRIHGPEIPGVTVVEEDDQITYVVVTQQPTDCADLARIFTKMQPRRGQQNPILDQEAHRRAAVIVAVNRRTGETRVIKNRFGDEGTVQK